MKSKSLKLGALLLATGGALLLSGNSSDAKAGEYTLKTPIGDIRPYLQIRPRYEYVDVKDSGLEVANAVTTRIKIGTRISNVFQLKGLSAQLEAIDVSALVDNFAPEKTNYEKVLDPPNTRLTQAYVAYKINKTTLFFGRKYVAIDDHRFIGTVNWRQMPQSFGVVGIHDNTINGLNILLAGIYERKGIIDDFNMDWNADKMPIIIDISYKIIPPVRIKAFAYLITDIHNTYGIRADGKINIADGMTFSYLGEYAIQRDPYETDNVDKKDKPDIDTDYYRVAGNIKYNMGAIGGFFGGVEYTHFGDANGKDAGFSTPLATLHKFEGWSDVLLLGAAKGYVYGMNEIKVSAGYKHPTFGKFVVSYLNFTSDKDPNGTLGVNGDKIGSEWDFAYSKKFGKYFSVLLKGAIYNADNGYIYTGATKAAGTKDTTKYWVQLNFSY
jgi:hypothetical protein